MQGKSIPSNILNTVLGEDFYSSKMYTLKDELEENLDKIEFSKWEINNGELKEFTAWTKNLVITLIDSPIYGEKFLLKVQRNYEQN